MTTPKDMKDVAAQQAISPLEGDPPAHILRDAKGAITRIIVEPVVLTPLRAKFADFLGGVSVLALSALGIGFVSVLDDPAPYCWLIAAVGPWPFTMLVQKAYRRLLRKRTVLEFTPEHFRVQGMRRPYNRLVPHQFRIHNEHKQAEKETERHEIIRERARMQGKVVRPTKYHCDTWYLYLVYGHKPHKLMEIMGKEEAEDIRGGLQAADEVMDEIVAMGELFNVGPSSEWDDMAGKIPEKF
jgi:hypothetical protein